jgi:hypothetical protein
MLYYRSEIRFLGDLHGYPYFNLQWHVCPHFFNLARSPLVFRGKHGQTCKNRSDRAIRFQKLSALGRPSWGQTRQHKKEAERAIR